MSLNCTIGSPGGPSLSTTNANCSDTQTQFFYCRDIPAGTNIWIFFSVLTFVQGFPSSVAVMLELVQRQRSTPPGTTTDMFFLNLTSMDIIFSLFSLLGPLNYLIWQIALLDSWVNFTYAFCLIGRPLFMSCICWECYLAVVHPITYMIKSHRCHNSCLSAAVWAFTVVFGFLTASNNIDFVSPVMAIAYCVNLLVIVCCDFFIIRALRKAGPGSSIVHPTKQKALQTVVNSLLMIVLFYLPPVLIYLYTWATFIPRKLAYCLYAMAALCSPMFSNSVMPLMYLANSGKPRCSWC